MQIFRFIAHIDIKSRRCNIQCMNPQVLVSKETLTISEVAIVTKLFVKIFVESPQEFDETSVIR